MAKTVPTQCSLSICSPLTRGDHRHRLHLCRDPISIHSPLTRGDFRRKVVGARFFISIHSPLTRGDYNILPLTNPAIHFNPLPSHEGRPCPDAMPAASIAFQSTPLSRGETYQMMSRQSWDHLFQSTPLSRGETPSKEGNDRRDLFQSTPLSRGETADHMGMATPEQFQSTPLSRGETVLNWWTDTSPVISIHSPLTRGDRKNRQLLISPSQIHYAIFTITSSTDLKLSWLFLVFANYILHFQCESTGIFMCA